MESSERSTRDGPDAEARYATILNCDVVDSTRVRRPMDLGAQLKFQGRFEQIVAGAAEKHGAHIEGFEGDGALVVFGFPNPSEDAPESAARMGLDLIDAIRDTKFVPSDCSFACGLHRDWSPSSTGRRPRGAKRWPA